MNSKKAAKEYAIKLWNDPESSPACQYIQDNEETFLAGVAWGQRNCPICGGAKRVIKQNKEHCLKLMRDRRVSKSWR